MTLITSGVNKRVQEFVGLRSERSKRDELGRVLVLGQKLIRDISKKVTLLTLIQSEQAPLLHDVEAREKIFVTEALMKKISGLQAPDGYAAIIERPQHRLNLCSRLLALDGVADPGNLGTLMRSAWAFGWDGVFLLPGCCDPYNDKALRSARAAQLFLPWQRGDLELLKTLTGKWNLKPFAADMKGEDVTGLQEEIDRVLLILGSEGRGLSTDCSAFARPVSIPMHEGPESLNVSTAGALLMWQLSSF